MSDTITSPRVEPTIGSAPSGPPPVIPGTAISEDSGVPVSRSDPSRPISDPVRPTPPATALPASAMSSPADQLARLEDKTSRIEEKLARSEAATQRVVDRFEAASHRMSEVALQADLVAVRSDVKLITRRLKALPGFAAVMLASLVTAILAAVFVILIFRYMPGLMQPR